MGTDDRTIQEGEASATEAETVVERPNPRPRARAADPTTEGRGETVESPADAVRSDEMPARARSP